MNWKLYLPVYSVCVNVCVHAHACVHVISKPANQHFTLLFLSNLSQAEWLPQRRMVTRRLFCHQGGVSRAERISIPKHIRGMGFRKCPFWNHKEIRKFAT